MIIVIIIKEGAGQKLHPTRKLPRPGYESVDDGNQNKCPSLANWIYPAPVDTHPINV
jgi:hypothetical protein